jgi:soluble cytochrome b562
VAITACLRPSAQNIFAHPFMKITPRFLALLLASLLPIAPLALHAEDKPQAESEDSDLGDAMSAMNGAFKKLRRQVADPKQNEASLALVAKLRKACVEAATILPEKIGHLPAKDQAAAKADYADKMKELIASVDDLATALKAGKNDEADKIIKDLSLQEEAGHKEFKPQKKGS